MYNISTCVAHFNSNQYLPIFWHGGVSVGIRTGLGESDGESVESFSSIGANEAFLAGMPSSSGKSKSMISLTIWMTPLHVSKSTSITSGR